MTRDDVTPGERRLLDLRSETMLTKPGQFMSPLLRGPLWLPCCVETATSILDDLPGR